MPDCRSWAIGSIWKNNGRLFAEKEILQGMFWQKRNLTGKNESHKIGKASSAWNASERRKKWITEMQA